MKHILIIEDNKFLAQSLRDYLEESNFKITLSEDGLDGLEKIAEIKPDLILLDVGMPKLNGFGVLEKLYRDPVLSRIPVIIVSNSGDPINIERAKNLGIKDYLIKANIRLEEVEEKIKKVFAEENFEEEQGTPKTSSEDAQKIKILIIEDDPFFAKLSTQALEEQGFLVSLATDGKQGLEKFEKQRPNLLLLDLILPKVNGFEVLKQIRENPDLELAKTPVVVLTNLFQKADQEKIKMLGGQAYLVKTNVSSDAVTAKIKEILEKE